MTLDEARALTPQQKNLWLARLMNWRLYEARKGTYLYQYAFPSHRSAHKDYYTAIEWDALDVGRFAGEVPPYCSNLDEIHEVEKTLTDEQWEDYADSLLYDLTGAAGYSNYTSVRRAREASAEDCATSLILTLAP